MWKTSTFKGHTAYTRNSFRDNTGRVIKDFNVLASITHATEATIGRYWRLGIEVEERHCLPRERYADIPRNANKLRMFIYYRTVTEAKKDAPHVVASLVMGCAIMLQEPGGSQ